MSARRLGDLDRLLIHAERVVSLLARCRPTNAAAEEARLLQEWRAGRAVAPSLVYPSRPDLDDLCEALDVMATGVSASGPWGQLYAGRAQELLLEADIVRHIGSEREVRAAAARRYPAGTGGDFQTALDWARKWARPTPPPNTPTFASDDDRETSSLLSVMRRAIGALRLPVRVEVSDDLASHAAAGAGVVFVRGRVRHTREDAERIALHELEGHVLPRLRAKSQPSGLFLAGTAGGSDDEEGRALLLEMRSGLVDDRRRAALGRRHLVALSVRQGADFVQAVTIGRDLGAELSEALALALRVTRGGGLGRELVYLPALARVEAAYQQHPDVERLMECGRVSVVAALALRDLGPPPDSLALSTAA